MAFKYPNQIGAQKLKDEIANDKLLNELESLIKQVESGKIKLPPEIMKTSKRQQQK
jgi:hypothetical protein